MSTVFASITTPGPAGPPGRTALWLTGTVPPVTAQGLDGDMYLNSTTGDVYGPKVTTWGGVVANIKGVPGGPGPAGPIGYSPLYIVAPGVPSNATGNNGDMYLNNTTSDLYGPKTAGAWGGIVANIRGTQGPPGVAYTPRGAWSAATTYVQGDMVSDGNIVYIALQSANLNHVPLTSPTWWQAAAQGSSQWITIGSDIYYNTGKVGIGTASPQSVLHVYRGSGGTTAIGIDNDSSSGYPVAQAIQFRYSSVGVLGGIYHQTDAGSSDWWLRFKLWNQSAETQRMCINGTTGNVGIGTAAPGAVFEVMGAQSIFRALVAKTNTTPQPVLMLTSNDTVGSTNLQLVLSLIGGAANGGRYTSIQATDNGYYYCPIVLNPAGGNVGIGTAAPIAILSVNAPYAGVANTILSLSCGYANAGDYQQIRFSADQSGAGIIQSAIRSIRAVTAGYGTHLAFAVEDSASPFTLVERMRITAGGNVGIGTGAPASRLSFGATEANIGSRVAFFETAGSANFRGIGMTNSGAGQYGVAIWAHGTAVPSATNMQFFVQDGGNVGIGTAAPSNNLHVAGDVAYQLRLSGFTVQTNMLQLGYNVGNNNSYIESTSAGVGRPLLLNPSGGNVGIGTTAPQATIHGVSSANYLPSVTANGPCSYLLFAAGAEVAMGCSPNPPNPFWLQTRAANSAWPLAINPLGGNVGIGTAAPACSLEVNGHARITGANAPVTGAGLELSYLSSKGYIMAYDNVGPVYRTLILRGTPIMLNDTVGGGVYISVPNGNPGDPPNNSQMVMFYDETNNRVAFRVRNAAGTTLKIGYVTVS